MDAKTLLLYHANISGRFPLKEPFFYAQSISRVIRADYRARDGGTSKNHKGKSDILLF